MEWYWFNKTLSPFFNYSCANTKKLPQKYWDGMICFLITKQVHWGQSEKQHSKPLFNIMCGVILQKEIEIIVLEDI